MVRVEESVVIDRPIEDVFAYSTDVERFPEWSALVHRVEKTSPDPTAVGMTFRQTLQFLGRQFAVDQVVTEFEPNRVIASKTLSGPVQIAITVTYRVVDGGTAMTWAIEGDGNTLFAMAEPVLARMLKRQITSQLGTLKDLLESGVQVPTVR